MERLYVFLIENRIGIYIFCALGLFWFISSLIRARNMLRGAIFSIERENAIRLQNTALIVVFVLLAVIGMVIYVNTAIRPTLAPELLIPPTFTPDIFATPLSSPTPLSTAPSQGPTDTPFFVATATLPPGIGPVTGGAVQTRPPRTPTTVTGTAPGETPTTPTDAAATTLAGCGSGLNITDPTPGSFISGTGTIVGTANIPDFFLYKLEIAGPETGGVWASLLSAVVQETVNNGSLGQANLAGWEPGEYNIRLTVVDQSSNDFGVCAVSVTLTTP